MATDPLDEHTERHRLGAARRPLAIVLAVLVALLMVGGLAIVINKPDGCHLWQHRLGPEVEGNPGSFTCVGRM